MEYGKDYFGFVYLWFDTKHKKYIIGSHHGSTTDGYTTSTGGKHVVNIFKDRPLSMKRKILAYNLTDDISKTKEIEQKYLDLRPSIYNNDRYYNVSSAATGWDYINDNSDIINPMTTEEGKAHHAKRMRELVDANKYHFGRNFIDKNPMKDSDFVANRPNTFTTENNPLNDPVIAEKLKQKLIDKLGKIVIIEDVEYPSLGEASRALGKSKQMLRHRLRSPNYIDHYFKEV